MSNGCFRVKKGFTVVQNNIARDDRLSIKAKGLYLVIQSYITMPDREWHKTDFMNMVSEGKGAFESAWKELKENGYIKCYVTSNGHGTNREYELLDIPEEGPWEIYPSRENENQERETIANTEVVQVPENQVPGNQVAGNQVHGNQVPDNRYPENKDLKDKTMNINNIYINPSFSKSDERKIDTKIPDISFDLSKPVDDSLYELVDEDLAASQGIPLDYAFDEPRFKIALAELAGWNDFLQKDENEITKETYRLVLELISEMGTTMGMQEIKGQPVSYKHVIDCLNRIMKDESASYGKHPLMFYVDCTVEKYIKATKVTNIRNTRNYLKSLIWENFHNYKLDWESSIQKTMHTPLEELKREVQEKYKQWC